MSDLTATNCGCGNNSNVCCNGNGFFGGNCSWIILLVFFCGGNGFGCGNGCGNGIFGRSGDNCGCGNDCCEWLIWILLLSSFCGNGFGNSCGNSCNNSCC